MGSVKVLGNPVLQEILGKLRSRDTPRREFRELLFKAGVFEAYEIAEELPTEECSVETPLGRRAPCVRVTGKLAIVAVLRAALPMAMGMLEVFPDAALGFVAAKRLEADAPPRDWRLEVSVPYVSAPPDAENLVIVDPMLATGSTLASVIERLKGGGYSYGRLYVATVISTEQGIRRVLSVEPEARIYTLSVDPELNDKAFIVPGLGDAGDRAFG